MPWIKSEMCVGCGICVRNCPSGAIRIVNRKAVMDMAKCIRCGVCHDICPRDAVRHDSERIPLDVQANVEWVMDLMKKFKTADEKKALVKRMKNHFNKERTVAEKTLEELETIKP